MRSNEDRITDLDYLTLRTPRVTRLTIADACDPVDGRWELRRLDAIAKHKGWHLEALDWTLEDEDGWQHDVECVVLLSDFVPSNGYPDDEPPHAEYFESARVFVEETPVLDELGEGGPRSGYYREVDEAKERELWNELKEKAESGLLDGIR